MLLSYIEPAICMDESWHWVAGAADFFVAMVLLWVALLATGELFISLMRVTRRVKPCSRAALLAGEASGASPVPSGFVPRIDARDVSVANA